MAFIRVCSKHAGAQVHCQWGKCVMCLHFHSTFRKNSGFFLNLYGIGYFFKLVSSLLSSIFYLLLKRKVIRKGFGREKNVNSLSPTIFFWQMLRWTGKTRENLYTLHLSKRANKELMTFLLEALSEEICLTTQTCLMVSLLMLLNKRTHSAPRVLWILPLKVNNPIVPVQYSSGEKSHSEK